MRPVTLLCCFVALASADPTVEGSLGKITGKVDTVLGIDIEAFLGIPYAKPPVEGLRFSLPQPFGAVGNLKATKFGSDCPQVPAFEFGRYSDDENCLFLNVFRKRGTGKDDKKAVFAIVHGGGFTMGSSAETPQSAEPLAGVGDVIVVSFNYRLGILGFADMKELAPGNLGLRDQRLALEWIQDHIADFGGDPQKVTIMGVSAGSMSVAAQIITTVDKKNLFQAAVLDAGVVTSHGFTESTDSSFTRTKKIAKDVGCPMESAELLECLRNVSVKALISNSSSYSGSSGIRYFVPTTDGNFLPHDVNEYITRNPAELRNVRTIVGYSLNEGSVFVDMASKQVDLSSNVTRDQILGICANISEMHNFPFDATKNETRMKIGKLYIDENLDCPTEALSSFIADGIFKCPINQFIRTYSSHNDKVFAYQFERKLNRTYFFLFDPDTLGAFHFSPYLHFGGALFLEGGTVNEADKSFSLDAMNMISNFSKSDAPLFFRGVEWPSFSKTGEVFIFNETPTVAKSLASTQNCRELFS